MSSRLYDLSSHHSRDTSGLFLFQISFSPKFGSFLLETSVSPPPHLISSWCQTFSMGSRIWYLHIGHILKKYRSWQNNYPQMYTWAVETDWHWRRPLCGTGSRALCCHVPTSEWCVNFKGKHLKVVRISDKNLLPFPQKNSHAPTNLALRGVTEPLFLIPG